VGKNNKIFIQFFSLGGALWKWNQRACQSFRRSRVFLAWNRMGWNDGATLYFPCWHGYETPLGWDARRPMPVSTLEICA